MTLQKYVEYEQLLKSAGFAPTSVAQIQHNNWVRKPKTSDDRSIVRVYVASDGGFKAYSNIGNVLGIGVSPWELRACI